MTNREAHEEAAGMNLDDMFFKMNGIDPDARAIKHHYLKTLSPYFQAVAIGLKPFEVRFNDRDYQVGDILHLQEFLPPDTLTGREILKEITYILDDPAYCKDGYVIIGFPDEKQIPKAPTHDKFAESLFCQSCGHRWYDREGLGNYCNICGQRLK